MSVDISRQRFDPANDYSGVLMQQGRVQLDADWNEWLEILDRRLRTETTDIIGRAVVPRETPDGFKLFLAAGVLSIGQGRMYVHGLLAENRGTGPMTWDPVLSELRGTQPVPYLQQPYFPATLPPPLPATAGPHLVYLDVWQREVTYVEQPDLIESAVGVDSTARWQTVWQVKVLPDVGKITCATPDDQVPGWTALIAPSAGRLTTQGVGVDPKVDLCQIPPTGGYRGLDNRTYRVEIHDAPGSPTFKWSRDNGSVVTAVTTINASRDQLGVVRTQRDDILRFSTNDWVEITDDYREWAGLPGEIRKVADVNDATKIITLKTALSSGLFPPIDAQGNVDPTRHMRIRRWDQQGIVRDGNGNKLVDLNAAASTGVIPVPAPGVSVMLEDGVQITFSLDSNKTSSGQFRIGDYWIFTARTADASVEVLTNSPPRGTHHHYARLGQITLPSTAPTDCRILWPPLVAGDASCDCTVCVSPDDHNNNKLTIQAAIEMIKAAGGGKICLEAGTYQIGPDSLSIADVQSLRLTGKGLATNLLYSGKAPAVVVQSCVDVTLEGFLLHFPPGQDTNLEDGNSPFIGLLLQNSQLVHVQNCIFQQLDPTSSAGLAIGLSGLLSFVTLRDNNIEAGSGIASLALDAANVTDTGVKAGGVSHFDFCRQLLIQDNFFVCPRIGVNLAGTTLFRDETRIAGNFIRGGGQAGIAVVGVVSAGGHVDIVNNELTVTGDGIRAGADQTSIVGNVINGPRNEDGNFGKGSGIALVNGLNADGTLRCQVIGNAISNIGGSAILIQAALLAATIQQNRIDQINGGGIVMDGSSSAVRIDIAHNQISNVGLRGGQTAVVGIQVCNAGHADVSDNSLNGVGLQSFNLPWYTGIFLLACNTMKIAGNEITDVGPLGVIETQIVGILVSATFEHVEITDNIVRRTPAGPNDKPIRWAALGIQGAALSEFARPGVGFLTLNANARMVGFFNNNLIKLVVGKEHVSVRGNLLAGAGATSTVFIDVLGECIFHDNHCERDQR